MEFELDFDAISEGTNQASSIMSISDLMYLIVFLGGLTLFIMMFVKKDILNRSKYMYYMMGITIIVGGFIQGFTVFNFIFIYFNIIIAVISFVINYTIIMIIHKFMKLNVNFDGLLLTDMFNKNNGELETKTLKSSKYGEYEFNHKYMSKKPVRFTTPIGVQFFNYLIMFIVGFGINMLIFNML